MTEHHRIELVGGSLPRDSESYSARIAQQTDQSDAIEIAEHRRIDPSMQTQSGVSGLRKIHQVAAAIDLRKVDIGKESTSRIDPIADLTGHHRNPVARATYASSSQKTMPARVHSVSKSTAVASDTSMPCSDRRLVRPVTVRPLASRR
ncbi:hypothetical protein EDD33_1995 [Nocardioides aurantiacus]|uniref:Uncharacterized protein n=1 Tax=Nocardioides aurantiacus TaxID=86796 RepID=A0A3N2CV78_9ACTN|nr:hypothetical protein EDD33_1995 [Nocardioides aurantiacus]